MTEGEFIRFYKKRNLSRSYKEVKEKIDIFWTVLLKALDEDGKVALKNWGVFEKKEVKSRKVVLPKTNEAVIIGAKKKIKFRTGTGLKTLVNRDDADE